MSATSRADRCPCWESSTPGHRRRPLLRREREHLGYLLPLGEVALGKLAPTVSVATTSGTVTVSAGLRSDLVDFLTMLGETLTSPRGSALPHAARSARENPATRRTVSAISQRRIDLVARRLDDAVARGELPPVDSYLVTQLFSGPAYSYVDQGLRPFTRTEAERITDIVLAGIRHPAS